MSMGRYEAALTQLDTAARLEPAQDLYRNRKQELLKLMRASNVRRRTEPRCTKTVLETEKSNSY